MPLITPPSDNTILPPDEPQEIKSDWDEYRRVQIFLNCLSWKCECGLTNFGRNKKCAKHTCKKPRPSDWRPK